MHSKVKCFICFLLSTIMGISVLASTVYAQSIAGCSVLANGGWGQGHSGMLYLNGFDNSSNNKSVMHVSGTTYVVKKGTKSDFLNDHKFLGYYRPTKMLSRDDQIDIINTALALNAVKNNIKYTISSQIDYDDKNSDGKVSYSEISYFRCDGFVEYTYEYNGIRIYGADNNHWNISIADKQTKSDHSVKKITPKKQAFNYMTNLLGDLNFNGTVSAEDSRTALRIASRLENANEYHYFVSDADGNGTVTASDAKLILKYASRQIAQFPGDPKYNASYNPDL